MRWCWEGFTGIVRKASAISVFAIYAPWPMVLMWSIASLIVWYCTDAFTDGMPSLMDVPTAWDKCCIILKEPISFFGTTPRGDVTKSWRGGLTKGLAIRPSFISLVIFSSTTWAKDDADFRFLQMTFFWFLFESNVKPKNETFYQWCPFLAITLQPPTQALYIYRCW